MTADKFERYAEIFAGNCINILASRTTQYQTDVNPLYNFEIGAEITGMTPAQTCWAYMSKHIAALRKKVVAMDLTDPDDWLEKCTDVANYAKLLYICAMDAKEEQEQAQRVISVCCDGKASITEASGE